MTENALLYSKQLILSQEHKYNMCTIHLLFYTAFLKKRMLSNFWISGKKNIKNEEMPFIFS